MSVDTYTCNHCGQWFGITGGITGGSDDDFAAEEHYAAEVEYHESGQCIVAVEQTVETVDVAPTPDPRAKLIEDLHAVADMLTSNPELPEPNSIMTLEADELRVSWSVWTDQNTAARIAKLTRLIGGRWDKNDPADDETYYRLRQRFGHRVALEISTYRDNVCERVVTGQREVTKEVPTAVETVTVTEDVYEWRCHSVLADAEAVA